MNKRYENAKIGIYNPEKGSVGIMNDNHKPRRDDSCPGCPNPTSQENVGCQGCKVYEELIYLRAHIDDPKSLQHLQHHRELVSRIDQVTIAIRDIKEHLYETDGVTL